MGKTKQLPAGGGTTVRPPKSEMATVHRDRTVVNEIINDRDAELEFKSENLTQLSFDRMKEAKEKKRMLDDMEEPEEEGEEEMIRSIQMNKPPKRANSRLIKLEPI